MTIYSGNLYTFVMCIWARISREEPFPLGEDRRAAKRERDSAKPQEKARRVRVSRLGKSCTLTRRLRGDLPQREKYQNRYFSANCNMRASRAACIRPKLLLVKVTKAVCCAFVVPASPGP